MKNETEHLSYRFDNKNFSPIEHLLIGSGIYSAELGGVVDIRGKANDAMQGDRNAYNWLLTPVNISEGKKSLAMVSMEREIAARSSGRYDTLQFIDIDQHLQFFEKKLHIWLEPSALDRTTGLILPEWRLKLFKNGVRFFDNEELLQKLEVVNGFNEWFSLAEAPSEGGEFRKLFLKIPSPTA